MTIFIGMDSISFKKIGGKIMCFLAYYARFLKQIIWLLRRPIWRCEGVPSNEWFETFQTKFLPAWHATLFVYAHAKKQWKIMSTVWLILVAPFVDFSCIVAISRKFSSPPEKREYKRHGLSDNYSGAAASVTTGWLWPIMKKVLGRAENSWTSGSILFSVVYVFSISQSRSLKSMAAGLDTSAALCQIDLFHFSQ